MVTRTVQAAHDPAADHESPDWWSDPRTLFAVMGIASILSTLAAAVASIQAYRLAVDAAATLAPHAFGFPDAFVMLAIAPVSLTIAVAGYAGVRLPRWFLLLAAIAGGLSLALAAWFLIQAISAGIAVVWWIAMAGGGAIALAALVRVAVLAPRDEPLAAATSETTTGWRHNRRVLFAVMGLSAIVCTVASAVLSIEAYHLAVDPGATLACDINEAVSCGKVAISWQAQVFGFPNAFIGLATEPVVLTIAVAGLAGVRFPRWFMFSAQIGYSLGLIFAYWLFYQSYANIGALCPWCLTITVFTTVTFFTMLHINVQERNLLLRPRAQAAMEKFVRLDLDLIVPVLLLIAIALLIMVKYGAQIF